MNDIRVSLPLEDLQALIESSRRVPELEIRVEHLQRSCNGLRQLYSEILEALRH